MWPTADVEESAYEVLLCRYCAPYVNHPHGPATWSGTEFGVHLGARNLSTYVPVKGDWWDPRIASISLRQEPCHTAAAL